MLLYLSKRAQFLIGSNFFSYGKKLRMRTVVPFIKKDGDRETANTESF